MKLVPLGMGFFQFRVETEHGAVAMVAAMNAIKVEEPDAVAGRDVALIG